MNLYEINKKLIGDYFPVGDASLDDERFENLKTLCDLVWKLMEDIDYVAYNYRHAHQGSVKRSCEYAKKFIGQLGIVE